MPLQFPARYSKEISSDIDDKEVLKMAAAKTVRDCAWKVGQVADDQLSASTSLNWQSSGETIEIELLSPSSLRITSKCAMPTQCFDWGKNRSNVEEFARQFEINAVVVAETGYLPASADPRSLSAFGTGQGATSIRDASTEQGCCRFELVVDCGTRGEFRVTPCEGPKAKTKPRRPKGRRKSHRSFALSTGSQSADYKFKPQTVSVPLEHVSEILIQNSRGPSGGCGRLISFVMLTLFLPPIGLIIAIYMAQQTGKSVPPSLTFFFDGTTGNKAIDEYGMESIDLEDDDVALALSQFLSSNTPFPVKYQ